MNQQHSSMTALVSAFARAWHAQNEWMPMFVDSLARRLFTDEEFEQMSQMMAGRVAYFEPGFSGDSRDALLSVINRHLAPTPLARAAFAEEALQNACRIGARQYLILGAGYDTFACRQPEWAAKLRIFEIDHPATARGKREKLAAAGLTVPDNVFFVEADFSQPDWTRHVRIHPQFDAAVISFVSLLGLTYYLPRDAFASMLSQLAALLPCGSSLAFDYPNEATFAPDAEDRVKKQLALAAAAGEPMCACYSYAEMEALLSGQGFRIDEHLDKKEADERFFLNRNAICRAADTVYEMSAFPNVNYCLAVKR